jgi:hypothetical protein
MARAATRCERRIVTGLLLLAAACAQSNVAAPLGAREIAAPLLASSRADPIRIDVGNRNGTCDHEDLTALIREALNPPGR